MAKFDLYRDIAGDYRWRFRTDDGRVIAVSSQAYLHPADCKSDVELLKAQAPEAVVDVLGEPVSSDSSSTHRGPGA